jgi:hypothetical protein
MAKTPSLKASNLFLFIALDLRNSYIAAFVKTANAPGSEKEKAMNAESETSIHRFFKNNLNFVLKEVQ